MPRDVAIAAGQRDKLVQIEQETQVTRESGMPSEDWDALGDPVYMSRWDVSADERFAANQESAWSRVRWQMPYQANMDPETLDIPRVRRLNFNGRIFNIQSATVLDRRIGIQLMTLAKAD